MESILKKASDSKWQRLECTMVIPEDRKIERKASRSSDGRRSGGDDNGMDSGNQNREQEHRVSTTVLGNGTSDNEFRMKEEKKEARKDQQNGLTDQERMELKMKSMEYRAKGNEYFAQEKWNESADEYTKALNFCPLIYTAERATLYDHRSECYMKMALWEEAFDDCTQLIEIGGSDATIQKRRAMCYVSLIRSGFQAFENYKMIAMSKPIEMYTNELHKLSNDSTETNGCLMKMVHLKDNMISEELRKAGNEYYVCGELESSLRMYFEALDTAPQEDLTYYLAMKNIATVLMKIGFSNEALKHLHRLLSNADIFANDKMNGALLRDRIRKCEKMPERKLYVPPEPKLHKGTSNICAQLSSVVHIKYDENRERHLVAAEKIPEGAVVVKEVPLIMAALNCVTICKYCSRLLPLSYLPCKDCNARFCDEKCRDRGVLLHTLDHLYGYGSGLKKMGMCELVAKAIFEFPFQEMKACIANKPNRRDVSRSFTGTSFTAIMLLKDCPFDDSNDQVQQFVDDICQVMDSKFTDATLSRRREFVATVTSELLRRIPINANCVYRNPQVASFLVESSGVPFVRETFRSRVTQLLARCPTDVRETLVGIALLPIASIANHSCVPNLYHSCTEADGYCFVMRTTREIRAGEELLCSYGPLAGYHTYEQRKNSLMQRYGFLCECEVCRHHGDHQIDSIITTRICYKCHRPFVVSECVEPLCESCHTKCSHVDKYGEDVSVVLDIEEVLDTIDWQCCHQKTLKDIFDRALNVYSYSNQALADFTVMAFLTAFRDGDMDAAYRYSNHLIEMRKAGFGDRVNYIIASAHFAFAIFLYIRMHSMESFRKVEQLEHMKRHAYEARQLFRILYGEGSVRDFELDFMLREARHAITQ